MNDRKDPRTGAKQGPTDDQVVGGRKVIDNEEPEARGVASRSDSDRRIEGLLRIIGSQDGNDHELTEEEAELIFDIAEAEPVADERLARIREGVLRRRFGTTPVPDESASVVGAGASAPSAADVPATRSKVVPDVAVDRPSLVKHCKSVKRKLADVATELHLDQETLFALDRGAARSVPRALVDAAATTLRLDRATVARCLAPANQEVHRMAAHGRPGAKASQPAPRRDFLEVIEASRLPEEEKRYWRHVVATESAPGARTSDRS